MIKKRFSLTRVMASFCFVFLVFVTGVFPGDSLSSEFFSPAGEEVEVVPDEAGVIRSRLVEIDPGQLSQLERLEQEVPDSPYLIYPDLFEDVYLEVLVRRVKSNFPGEYYCKVDIENIPRSKAFFEIKQGMFSAYIAFHGQYYLVRPIRDRIYKIEEVDRARFLSQLPPRYHVGKQLGPQDKTAVVPDQTASLPASERAALIALYNSTDGDGWSHNTGWKTPPLESDGFGAYGSEGTWFGVTVSAGHVTKLDLNYNGLSGTLPTEIGNLTYLDYFDVNDNYNGLIGVIPSQIGNLTKLTFCGLGDDEFSGSIPSTIGNLTKLEYLYLHDNDLSGPIPSTIGNLTKLLHLHMDDNRFSGGIPPEIGNLTSLEYFDANESKISSSLPSTMGNLTSLQHLNLCGNQLTGSLPSSMGNLNKLVYVKLSGNQLSGSIPAQWGNLSSLDTLYLYSNQLSGAIPGELGNLGNLRYLNLSHNQLSGSIPTGLGNLAKIYNLNLSDNRLSGVLPSQLGNLSTLRYLYLYGNNLVGSLPSSLTNLTGLYSMDIGYNGLYTNNEILRTFINGKDSDWENTQTIAPANVSASVLSPSSIRVSWTPIVFTSYTGGYHVYYSTTSGGPWSYAGSTANKSAASYDVTGLTPGTTYYFVIKTQTNPNIYNDNTVVSDYSQETSATTPTGTGTYTLTVQSSPDTGVVITVSPNDNNGNGNGTTNFARTYYEGMIVTLTAPPSHNGKIFSKWSVDGSDQPGQTVQVTMNTNHTLTAIYEAGTSTYTLTVQSSPNTGIAVTVSPNDKNGNGNGTTNFTRTYNDGTIVTLTAPASHNGKIFSKWSVDGSYQSSQTIQVTMNTNRSLTAIYEGGTTTYTLTVQSSPNTGIAVTVSPNDNSGNGNGTTNFTRTYNDGTIVTLTAPASHNGKNFSKWSIDGSYQSSQTVQVTMNTNRSLTAIYEGGTTTYALTVQSSPNTGVAVTVSPNDNNGNGNGTTNFTRIYNKGTIVTLTAPASHNGKVFSKWTVDGAAKTGQTITVTMNGNHTAKAFYGTGEPAHIELNRTRLNFGAVVGGPHTGSQHILIGNSGGSSLAWTASASANWIQVSPLSGTENMTTSVSVQVTSLSTGSYHGTVTITDTNADNSPVTVDIYLEVKTKSKEKPVFGSFDSPVHGAKVCSSIAVTGWAVDDVEVSNVQIFRNPVPGHETGLMYIGDAVFVEGPRPDVEAAYPGYPKSYQAGWGYMMLTNFLPDGGNGTYVIYAVATDSSGNEVTLGSKTIHCDNANAVKPFGAIDTPGQGGNASGNSFTNWGWVLTPQPNSIPASGTTINVWVDGVNVGQPTYNLYRSDIAGLFPGYVNSYGAAGYFYLDTTGYENGVHTIQWTAKDSAGNTDGIGSRYFTVMNTGSNAANTAAKSAAAFNRQAAASGADLARVPVDYYEPIEVTTGYESDSRPQTVYPDENGNITIEIHQMDRVEIRFFGEEAALTNSTRSTLNVSPLPIGSTMDIEKGVFYWQPGPAFLGEYRLVFIDNMQDLAVGRKNIIVKIVSQFE
jgi:Leucine-rich repeat (LRR) protein